MTRADAVASLDRARFEPAVRTVLATCPDGLSAEAIRRRIHGHPAFALEVPMADVHWWLYELCRTDVLVTDARERRYWLVEHAAAIAEDSPTP